MDTRIHTMIIFLNGFKLDKAIIMIKIVVCILETESRSSYLTNNNLCFDRCHMIFVCCCGECGKR